MTLRATLLGIAALLLGAGSLNLGMGLQASLLGVRAGIENFPTLLIGLVMSAYYAGFVLGSLYAPGVVARVGHIRTFSAFASLASAAAICHAVFVDPLSWILFRALTGFCFAALCLVAESWLNARASNLNRGTVVSIYFVVMLGMTAAGQAFLMMAPPEGYDLFVFVSVIISLALVPIALTSTPSPEISAPDRMSFRRLYSVSPVGTVGTFSAGLITGAYWGLGAVFAQAKGLVSDDIAVFMTLLVLGGVVTQWPFGRLSDRMDRRIVIGFVAIAIAVVGILVSTDILPDDPWLYVMGAVMGGLVLPLYGLVLAHTNDHLEAEDFVPAGAALLMLYGMGAVLGPLLGTLAMRLVGAGGLFLYLAISAIVLATFTAYRMTQRAAVDVEDTESFVPVTSTTAMAYELDPRSEDEGDQSPQEDPEAQAIQIADRP
ncbi:MFS transporter [Kordiimonas lacus]|uniref:Predicted arabinose efflux permease, MFS family n=1 Tax=Kordiimonas lacus TaxID=637679 RepID=A0A1G7BIF5_9PROT|nr:MFS transporter [Kordiimonas lacus]SDE26854.1 Predicted arabinose efflux permease, MFS family [Kordiimonas lacus]